MGKVARWFKGVFGTTSKNRERQNQDGFSETTKLPTRLSTDTKKVSDVKCAKLTGGDIIITREERRAAVTIQKVFRGSLARKALRALKGIVKLQALVRGFLVRKRAAAMLESIETLIRLQTAARTKRINRCTNKENRKTNQPRQSIDKFDAWADDERSKIVEMDDVFKRRLKCKQVRDVSEYEEDFVYNGNEMVLRLPGEKRKFATAQNTPRFFFASHQHAGNNRYYAKQSMAKGNTLCDNETNSPGYMEKTQSFKAKLRSHSAPRQRTERKRLSLDEVLASRNSDASVGMVQPQRYSCCYYPY